MKYELYLEDRDELQKQLSFFENKKQIQKISLGKSLVQAHIEKAKHNLEFFNLNQRNTDYNDWLIVVLYYSLYHISLSLIAHKGFKSKNHTATLLLLLREYEITHEEAQLIEVLSLKKDDAELYTNLKEDRHNASYSTSSIFSEELIKDYKNKVIDFLDKAEELIKN